MIFVPYLKTCRSEEAHLASIHSLWENKFVGALEPSSRVWLGGTDSAKEGTWKWTDGTNFSCKYWHKGEPNNLQHGTVTEGCAHMHIPWLGATGENKWNDWNCFNLAKYVCKKDETKLTGPDTYPGTL